MKLVDTHAHLDFPQFDADRAGIIAELEEQQIGVIDVATDTESIARVDQLSRENPLVWGALGLHPTSVADISLTELPNLIDDWQKRRRANPKIVAVGEVGLDYFHDRRQQTASAQKAALREMLTFALAENLPVIFHCREAYGDLATIVADYPGLQGVVHCFSGHSEQADRFLELGLYLSATNIITYPKNQPLAAIFAQLPAERIMVETDSPFLPSADQRGARNDPRSVVNVVNFLAQIRRQTPDEVGRFTTQNACGLFQLTNDELD